MCVSFFLSINFVYNNNEKYQSMIAVHGCPHFEQTRMKNKHHNNIIMICFIPTKRKEKEKFG
jgi:hypothetical protein